MSSELTRAIAQATGRVVLIVGSDGRLVEDSPSWRAHTGQPEGADWRDAIHPDDRAAVLAAMTGEWEVEHLIRRPGDRHTRARTRGVPLPSGGWVVTTSEVWADETVRRSEERLRLATQAANVAIWEYDFVNGQMTRTENHDALYGLPQREVWVYEEFTSATHPDDRGLADRTIQACVAPGGAERYAFDFRVIWPDGSVHWLHVAGEVVAREPSGRATLVRGALIDVTRLKDAEAELREAVRVRDEFMQIASHELKTPLTPLTLKLQSLERAGLSNRLAAEVVLRDVAVAQRQVARLVELVDDLLDVSRLAKGRLELTRVPLTLADVVASVVEQTSSEAARSGCELRLAVKDEAPGVWDRSRLEQVVENLLSNAMKYGRGEPIELEVAADGERARLVVRDRGIGIDDETMPRIFDKFERGPASPAHYGGMGLGLYIVRQIVDAHGGDVRAESRPGAGTTFIVELPRG